MAKTSGGAGRDRSAAPPQPKLPTKRIDLTDQTVQAVDSEMDASIRSAVRDLPVGSTRDHWQAALDQIDRGRKGLSIMEGGKPVALVSYQRTPGMVRITHISASPDSKYGGIRAIYEMAAKAVRGNASLKINVQGGTNTIKFYDKLGFSRSGRIGERVLSGAALRAFTKSFKTMFEV